MNHTQPSVQDVSTNILNQISAALGQSIPILPKAFLWVLSRVLGAVFILLYKFAGFALLQMFVPYASTKEVEVNGQVLVPLIEWGRLLGVGDPLAATRAVLDVTVTVSNQVGTLGPGAQLLRSDTGVVYVTTGPVALNGSTVTARVRASSDQSGNGGLGTIGNLQVADALSFASPLPNISRDCVVGAVVVTAEDAESWDNYRQRILERAQARPQGGAYADYRTWAREVPGIVAVYPYTGDPGQVDVYVEASVASSGSEDGIPTEDQLDAVRNSINYDVEGLATRRPANAAVNVLGIDRLSYDVEISDLALPNGADTSALRTEIEEALRDYYWSREPYIVGLSVLPRKDRVLEAEVIGITIGIVGANGATVGPIVVTRSTVPMPIEELTGKWKARLNTVNFS